MLQQGIIDEDEKGKADEKLKKKEQELMKISTGIGKVFLDIIQQREKVGLSFFVKRLNHILGAKRN